MPQLMAALGTDVRQTALRKLKPLRHLISHSHRGGLYSQEESAAFDVDGLWSLGVASFSRHGTSLATAVALVRNPDAGFSAIELDALSRSGLQGPLAQARSPWTPRPRVGRLQAPLLHERSAAPSGAVPPAPGWRCSPACPTRGGGDCTRAGHYNLQHARCSPNRTQAAIAHYPSGCPK